MEKEFQSRAEIEVEDVMFLCMLAKGLVGLNKKQLVDLHDMLWPESDIRKETCDRKGKKMQMPINATAEIAQTLADGMQPYIQEYIKQKKGMKA